jgi:hypothetical protein
MYKKHTYLVSTERGRRCPPSTQKCRPAKGISERVNIQIIKDTDITEQPNNKEPT